MTDPAIWQSRGLFPDVLDVLGLQDTVFGEKKRKHANWNVCLAMEIYFFTLRKKLLTYQVIRQSRGLFACRSSAAVGGLKFRKVDNISNKKIQ